LGTWVDEVDRLVADLPTEPATVERVVELLCEGVAVARCVGRGGYGRHGGGTRSVLCLAEPAVVDRARAALGRTDGEAPVVARLDPPDLPGLRAPARWGAAAAPTRLGMRALQWVHEEDDPELHAILSLLRKRGATDALAVFPLGYGREPAVERPDDALATVRRTDLELLWLGPHLVRP
jgi:predicted NodU family carbamoyl transferase